MKKVAAVIVAGGSGKRMKSAIKKQYIKLEGREVLAHTISVFQHFKGVDEIIVVVSKEEIETVRENIVNRYGFTKVSQIVEGGAERQDSVYNGIQAAASTIEYVMIHDGARPFIKEETLEKALIATREKGATIVAVPVKDTIKVINNETMTVEATPQRETLWSVQTPQSFEKQLLLEAYEYAKTVGLQVTDDSMLVEALGRKVQVVLGEYTNIKLTTPEDLLLGESILKEKN